MGAVLYSADIISAVPDILRSGLYFCGYQNYLIDQNPIDISILTMGSSYSLTTSGSVISIEETREKYWYPLSP